MSLSGVAQRIEHDARLDSGNSSNRIDLDDPVHVFREVENDCDVAALTRETGSRASRQHWSTVRPAYGDGRDDVGGVAGNDESNRNLTVVRTIGCIQRAAAPIEPDFATNLARQCLREIGCLTKCVDWLGVRTGRKWNDQLRDL
jgi:hypothetical protein